MDGGGGAHGETALLRRQGNPAAPESQGDQSGSEEAHTARGGAVVTLNSTHTKHTHIQDKHTHGQLSCVPSPSDAESV